MIRENKCPQGFNTLASCNLIKFDGGKMVKQFIFDYDDESDSIFIKMKDAKIKGSVDIGDYIIDFTPDGKIAGLEILNLSENFPDMPKHMGFVDCSFDVRYDRDNTVIIFSAVLKNGEKIHTNVPILTPIPVIA